MKIRTLNQNDLEMTRLHDEGVTLQTIADRFGNTRENVRQHISKIRRKERGDRMPKRDRAGRFWTDSYAYQRLIETLNTYWLSQPYEKRVSIDMHFEHDSGMVQDKKIVWNNPDLIDDAVRLISLEELSDAHISNEARLLSYDEYLALRGRPPYMPTLVWKEHRDACDEGWHIPNQHRHRRTILSDYGRTWRCWTAVPTLEQQAIPWEKDKRERKESE